MKKTVFLKLAIGLLLFISALYTYIPEVPNMCELTFLSNMAGAFIFMTDGIYELKTHKQFPKVLYLIETVTLSMVFLVTVGGTVSGAAHFNFHGGMVFLHVINPVLVTVFYLFLKGEQEFKWKDVLAAPVFLIVFLLFDYIRFLVVGSLVYGLLPEKEMTLWNAAIAGAVVYLIAGLLGLLLYSVGRIICKKTR